MPLYYSSVLTDEGPQTEMFQIIFDRSSLMFNIDLHVVMNLYNIRLEYIGVYIHVYSISNFNALCHAM